MHIRRAKASDISALVQFSQAMALETEEKKLDAETLFSGVSAVLGDEGKGFYLVAELDGEIAAGLMVTYEWSDWRNAWFWWIQSVYVRPQHRGKAVYGQLYSSVKKLAVETRGVCGFRLYVEKENERAKRVYEKQGMQISNYVMYEEIIKAGTL